MRKFKYLIGILLLFLIVGFATISVTLSISGNANVISNLDDFKVYFSNVSLNNNPAERLIKNDKELVFDFDLKELGETYTITYDVTNASRLLDAALSINCTQSNEYLTITNQFDTSTLPALTSRTGNLTIKKKKTSASETTDSYPITCNIVASPIERTTTGTGSVVGPVAPAQLAIGDVISIRGENFNVISVNNSTVSMLAAYGLDEEYRQNYYAISVNFSNTNGWVNTPGPKEIDIQAFDGPVKTYVNEYTNYIKELTKEDNITGDLITVKQLKSLGCTIQATNYTFSSGDNCGDSEYSDWLVTNQWFWTKSAWSNDANTIAIVSGKDFYGESGVLFSSMEWYICEDPPFVWYPPEGTDEVCYKVGFGADTEWIRPFYYGDYELDSQTVRPVITMSIETARKYAYSKYEIGREITISTDKFNIVKDNGDSISLIAQYALDSNYRQSTTPEAVIFSDTVMWQRNEDYNWNIDIQTQTTNAKKYVNNYVSYIKTILNDNKITGRIINQEDLSNLSCWNYGQEGFDSNYPCNLSKNASWLINGQDWWTANFNYYLDVEYINGDGTTDYGDATTELKSIRPVITISKDTIERYIKENS